MNMHGFNVEALDYSEARRCADLVEYLNDKLPTGLRAGVVGYGVGVFAERGGRPPKVVAFFEPAIADEFEGSCTWQGEVAGRAISSSPLNGWREVARVYLILVESGTADFLEVGDDLPY